jgi:hypothetical protein
MMLSDGVRSVQARVVEISSLVAEKASSVDPLVLMGTGTEWT